MIGWRICLAWFAAYGLMQGLELLAFARRYPNEQLKFPIVALGSEALLGGDRRVAYLCRGGADRDLLLSWAELGWRASYRFLVVRKGK